MTAVILLSATSWLHGIERMNLPSFQVTTAAGRTVSSTDLVRPGRWLLIVVRPNCLRCEAILRLIKKDEHPLVPQRVVILVDATSAEAVRAGSAEFPDLVEAGWFADPARASVGPLKLSGAPAIFGIDGNMIEWSLAGVLADTNEVKSVLASWVEPR